MNFKWNIPDDKTVSSIETTSSKVRFQPAVLFGYGIKNDEQVVRSLQSQQMSFCTFLRNLEEDDERILRRVTFARRSVTIELCCNWEPEYYLKIQEKFNQLWPD